MARAQLRYRFLTRPRDALLYPAKKTSLSSSVMGLNLMGSLTPGYCAGCETVDGIRSLSQQTKTAAVSGPHCFHQSTSLTCISIQIAPRHQIRGWSSSLRRENNAVNQVSQLGLFYHPKFLQVAWMQARVARH